MSTQPSTTPCGARPTRSTSSATSRASGQPPRPSLTSDSTTGTVTLDAETVLSGIPAAARDHRVGNRTAIEWVLDQHKEKTSKDPTIRARFDTDRFADLIARMTRVSVDTVAIVDTLLALPRAAAVPPGTG